MHRFAHALKSYWIRTDKGQSECGVLVRERKCDERCCRNENSEMRVEKQGRRVVGNSLAKTQHYSLCRLLFIAGPQYV
jgi:hypothetical protein